MRLVRLSSLGGEVSGAQLNLSWKPPGPVSSAFMRSKKPVQILNGPIGSGKTTTNMMKSLFLASAQMPSTRDGKRKFKLCVVRDTYRQLWKTTLPSWWKRVPRSVGEFLGAENAPASHHIAFQLRDGTEVDFHVDFLAIGENAVEDVLRGFEPTAFYLNEMDLLAREVFTYARGRAGRYPDMSEGGPTWYGILGDCNAPVLSSWLYQDVFRNTPEHIDLFIQPGGLEPGAENRDNLPPGYYENQISDQPEWYIERMINNRPGYSRAGKPVYPEFKDTLHVAKRELEPIPGIALQIGLDAGLSPAGIFGQRMPNGQWRIVDELVAEKGTGPLRFGDSLAQRLNERFNGFRTIKAYADPAAQHGADKKAGELDWIEIVAKRAAIQIVPAPTNRLIPRLEAVRKPLTMLIDAEPAFLLSPRCMILREGFNSGYAYKKLTGHETDRYTDEPDKNEYSHPHDGLQYLMSGGGEDLEIRDRKARSQYEMHELARSAITDWDPLALGR